MSEFVTIARRSALALAMLAGSNIVAACSGDSKEAAEPTTTGPTSTSTSHIEAKCTYAPTTEESAQLEETRAQLMSHEEVVTEGLQDIPRLTFTRALARIAEVGRITPNPHMQTGTPVELTVEVFNTSYDVHAWYAEPKEPGPALTNRELAGLLPAEIKVFRTGEIDGDYTINDAEASNADLDGKVDILGQFGSDVTCNDSFETELARLDDIITSRTDFLPEAQRIYGAVLENLAADLGS